MFFVSKQIPYYVNFLFYSELVIEGLRPSGLSLKSFSMRKGAYSAPSLWAAHKEGALFESLHWSHMDFLPSYMEG